MPVPKRWHPVSRDLNDDAELWEFTHQFGERSLRLFLEVFSLIDKHENRWRYNAATARHLANKLRMNLSTITAAVQSMIERRWLVKQEEDSEIISSSNYWKFHKRPTKIVTCRLEILN